MKSSFLLTGFFLIANTIFASDLRSIEFHDGPPCPLVALLERLADEAWEEDKKENEKKAAELAEKQAEEASLAASSTSTKALQDLVHVIAAPLPALHVNPEYYSHLFKYHITEPIRTITRWWAEGQIPNSHVLYWEIRMVVENNLSLYLSAPRSSITNLRNIIHNSNVPQPTQHHLTTFLFDYFHHFHTKYWYYHCQTEDGLLHFCHNVPDIWQKIE